LSEQDKQLVEEEIRMHMAYDWFIDDNPDVQERITKAELRALQQMVLDAIKKPLPITCSLGSTTSSLTAKTRGSTAISGTNL
jgi:hypothetical protein